MLDEDLTAIPDDKVLLRSNNSLGHGIMNDIYDVIYVKTDDYSASHNQEIAWEIEKLNQQFLDEGRNYVLVGPGRWGSSDTWLGIPVKWPHISAARVIVEAGLTNYRVDPSQGTHFFQNLTSFGVGYFMPKMMPKMRSHERRTFRSHISRSFCHQPNLPLNLPIRRLRSGTVMKNPIGSSLK